MADLVCRGSLRSYLEAMKLDSKYFDSVRVRPDHARPVEQAPGLPVEGLPVPRARIARRAAGATRGSIYLFCLDHVRQFNASYNYFDGMSNAEVEAYQKDSVIGHRPTWKAGANAWAHGTRHGGSSAETGGARPTTRMPSFLGVRVGRARRRRRAAPSSRWRQKRWIRSISRRRPRRPRSSRASRSWSSATTPTPTAATRAPRTSCAKSSKPITI